MNHPLQPGIELIKKWEGLRLMPYLCPAGIPTIGYGHVMSTRERSGFAAGINEDTAEHLLMKDCDRFILAINRSVQVPLSILQVSSLLSWTFNLGAGNLRSSTMLKKINAEEHGEVPYQIRRWNKCRGQVLDGLVARREDEAQLYIMGTI